jgi:uncharacterized protein
VKVVSDAELGGVLADFARAGGIAVANVIMNDFARRAAEEFAKDDVPAPAHEPASASAEPPTAASAPPERAATQPAVSASPTAAPAATPSSRPASAPVPLAAHTLLWAVIKAQFARLVQWLGLGRRA